MHRSPVRRQGLPSCAATASQPSMAQPDDGVEFVSSSPGSRNAVGASPDPAQRRHCSLAPRLGLPGHVQKPVTPCTLGAELRWTLDRVAGTASWSRAGGCAHPAADANTSAPAPPAAPHPPPQRTSPLRLPHVVRMRPASGLQCSGHQLVAVCAASACGRSASWWEGHALAASLETLLSRPRMLLYRTPGESRIPPAELDRRCESFRAGHWADLLCQSADAAAADTGPRRTEPSDAQRARRAGELSAAGHALTAQPLATGTGDTLAELRDPERRPPPRTVRPPT